MSSSGIIAFQHFREKKNATRYILYIDIRICRVWINWYWIYLISLYVIICCL